MDIRRNDQNKLNPVIIDQIISKTEKLPWIRRLIEGYIELLNLCENDDEKKLVDRLLDNFIVLDTQKLADSLQKIKDHLVDTFDIKSNNTMFYAFSDNKTADGSQFVIQAFKNKFEFDEGWREKNFSNSLLEINNHNSKYTNIFLIDDFIGTGTTTHSKYTYAKKVLDEKKISYALLEVIAIAGMEFSKILLDSEKVPFYCSYFLKKGISEVYPPNEVAKNIAIMKDLESRLNQKRGKKYFPLGFGQSESLFAIEGINIPNNVFPVFWWPNGIDGLRKTIFKGLR